MKRVQQGMKVEVIVTRPEDLRLEAELKLKRLSKDKKGDSDLSGQVDANADELCRVRIYADKAEAVEDARAELEFVCEAWPIPEGCTGWVIGPKRENLNAIVKESGVVRATVGDRSIYCRVVRGSGMAAWALLL